jgi:UDP-N-acetyl-D-mannosaminuronic acid dehydrogenase
MKNNILSKIKSRAANVVVLGLGYVGLSNAAIITKAGFRVVGIDIDTRRTRLISKGRIDTDTPGLMEMIHEASDKGFLKVVSNYDNYLKKADIMIVCVPTPVKEDKKPDLSFIEDVCREIARNLSQGKLVIVESTLPPKTTKNFIASILEKDSGLKCGRDFLLCYCPERINPGETIKQMVLTNKILGGYNVDNAKVAAEFFATFIKGQILITDSTTAELSKVAENTFRDVNIAYANELALICEVNNSDVSEVIKLANTHSSVNIHTPGTGVGGACLPKDPYLLLSNAVSKGFKSKIIINSRFVNDYMPQHTVDLVLKALQKAGKQIEHASIAVLGTSYKANVGDSRQSPSMHIIHKLLSLGANVCAYDPFCEETFGARKASSVRTAVKNTDCIVISTAHQEFKKVDLMKIANLMNSSPIIVDGRRIIKPEQAKRAGIVYYGIGFGKGF